MGSIVSYINKVVNFLLSFFKLQLIIKDRYHLLRKSDLTYASDWLYTYHNADFLNDPIFNEAYELGANTDNGLLINTDIKWRVHVLCWAAKQASLLDGDFVDCGVSTGIFARSIIHYTDFNSLGKTYFLLDTFNGMDPKYSSEEELKMSKVLNYDSPNHNRYEEVKKTFAPFNTKIIKGSVPETLPLVNSDKIALLNIDMNAAIPEYEALNYFWDKIVSGGVIILDDFGYLKSHINQKKIHMKFAKEKGVEILHLPTCQGMIIKP